MKSINLFNGLVAALLAATVCPLCAAEEKSGGENSQPPAFQIRQLAGHTGPVWDLCFTPARLNDPHLGRERAFAQSRAFDGAGCLWKRSPDPRARAVDQFGGWDLFATIADKPTIWRLDAFTSDQRGEERDRHGAYFLSIKDLAFTSDSRSLVVASANENLATSLDTSDWRRRNQPMHKRHNFSPSPPTAGQFIDALTCLSPSRPTADCSPGLMMESC